jgi:hypothetical protein
MISAYKSFTSLFVSGKMEIPISEFTNLISFYKDDLVNAWDLSISSDRDNQNLFKTSPVILSKETNGDIVINISQNFYNYIKANTENCICYLINDYHKDGGILYTPSDQNSSPVFQIPFTGSPVVPKNILTWKYDSTNDVKNGIVSTTITQLYPNIYDFRSSNFSQYTNTNLYIEWYNSEKANGKFDNNIKKYMDYKGSSFITESINGTLPAAITNYSPLNNFQYEVNNFLASPDYPNLRQYKKSKLISILADNPIRYKELMKYLNYSNKNEVTVYANKTLNADIFSRSVLNNHAQITNTANQVTFSSACTYIKCENSNNQSRAYYMYIDGKRVLPTNVSSENGYDYIYIDKSKLTDTSEITIDSMLDSYNNKVITGEIKIRDINSKVQFPNAAEFKNISGNNLVFFDSTTKEYIDPSYFSYWLNALAMKINYDNHDYGIQYGSQEYVYLMTSLNEFFHTLQDEQVVLYSQAQVIAFNDLFNKKINASDTYLSTTNTQIVNKDITISTANTYRTESVADLNQVQTISFNNFTGKADTSNFKVYIDGKLASPDQYQYTAPTKYGDAAAFTITKYKHDAGAIPAIIDYIPSSDTELYNGIPSLSLCDSNNVLHLETITTHPFDINTAKIFINGERVPISKIHDIGGNDMIYIDGYTNTNNLTIYIPKSDTDCYDYSSWKNKSIINQIAKTDLAFESYLINNL